MEKNILDKYFTRQYNFLLGAVKNINGRTNLPEDLYYDLLNELYVYLVNKTEKWMPNYNQKGEKGLDAYCLVWLRNQSNWISTFKQKYDINIRTYLEYEMEKDERSEAEFDVLSIYDEDLRLYYTDFQIERLLCIKQQYPNLPDYYKNLYDLYFIKNLTMAQIEQIVGISKGSVHYMLHSLYKHLKKKCR